MSLLIAELIEQGSRTGIMCLCVYETRCWLLWHDRQYDPRCVSRIMVDRVQRDAVPALLTELFASVGVDIKSGEVTAGDIESNTVPAPKNQRSRIHFDSQFHRLPRYERFRMFERVAITGANNTIPDVEIDSSRIISVGWINIDQLRREVGIGAVGRRPELHDQTTSNLRILIEGCSFVDKDV